MIHINHHVSLIIQINLLLKSLPHIHILISILPTTIIQSLRHPLSHNKSGIPHALILLIRIISILLLLLLRYFILSANKWRKFLFWEVHSSIHERSVVFVGFGPFYELVADFEVGDLLGLVVGVTAAAGCATHWVGPLGVGFFDFGEVLFGEGVKIFEDDVATFGGHFYALLVAVITSNVKLRYILLIINISPLAILALTLRSMRLHLKRSRINTSLIHLQHIITASPILIISQLRRLSRSPIKRRIIVLMRSQIALTVINPLFLSHFLEKEIFTSFPFHFLKQ